MNINWYSCIWITWVNNIIQIKISADRSANGYASIDYLTSDPRPVPSVGHRWALVLWMSCSLTKGWNCEKEHDSANYSPVWFENWTELIGSTSNPSNCMGKTALLFPTYLRKKDRKLEKSLSCQERHPCTVCDWILSTRPPSRISSVIARVDWINLTDFLLFSSNLKVSKLCFSLLFVLYEAPLHQPERKIVACMNEPVTIEQKLDQPKLGCNACSKGI